MEIQKREEDSTTDKEEWGNLILEEEEEDINSNKDPNGGQPTASFTNASNKSEEELKHAKNELNRQAAEMNELEREMAEIKEWKAQQEAFNQASTAWATQHDARLAFHKEVDIILAAKLGRTQRWAENVLRAQRRTA